MPQAAARQLSMPERECACSDMSASCTCRKAVIWRTIGCCCPIQWQLHCGSDYAADSAALLRHFKAFKGQNAILNIFMKASLLAWLLTSPAVRTMNNSDAHRA